MAQLIRISDTIWCIRRRSYFSCSYIVASSEGLILIDAGMGSDGVDIFNALSTPGLRDRPVRAVLLTHWHNDHAAGGRAIKDRLNADVFYHALDAPFLTGIAARSGFMGAIAELVPETGLLVLLKGLIGNSVPRLLDATELVSDGDILFQDFEVIETPGHTPGHTSYYYRPEQALFSGDALAVVKGSLRYMARAVTPDQVSGRKSMIKCLSRELRVICPGHREPITVNVNSERDRLLEKLEMGKTWPLFG
jgi:glyoxylase-like metal-dependent hydrolase (beta-lactamase superfamily II)